MAATKETLQRLETRALGAEKLIQLLKTQINQLKTGSGNNSEAKEVATLRAENEALKKDIADWKNKLIAAETANGVKQVNCSAPTDAAPPQHQPVAEKPVADAPKTEKKAEKKKKEKAPPQPQQQEEVHVGRYVKSGKIPLIFLYFFFGNSQFDITKYFSDWI